MIEKRIKFNESLWEEFVKESPEAFLDEKLIFDEQQRGVYSGRIDLTFRDSEKRLVIVEIQLHALDKYHMYRAIDYKSDFEEMGEKDVRVILLCNSIDESKKKFLNRWGLELKTIELEKVKSIIKKIDPSLFFVDSINDQNINNYYNDKTDIVEKYNDIDKRQDLNQAIELYRDVIQNTPINPNLGWGESDPKLDSARDLLVKCLKSYKKKHHICDPIIYPEEKISTLRERKTDEYFGNIYFSNKDLIDEIGRHNVDSRFLKFCETEHNFFDKIMNHTSLRPKKDENIQRPGIDLILTRERLRPRDEFSRVVMYWQPSNWKFNESDVRANNLKNSLSDWQPMKGYNNNDILGYKCTDIRERESFILWDVFTEVVDRKYKDEYDSIYHLDRDNYIPHKNFNGHMCKAFEYFINKTIKNLSNFFAVNKTWEIFHEFKKLNYDDKLILEADNPFHTNSRITEDKKPVAKNKITEKFNNYLKLDNYEINYTNEALIGPSVVLNDNTEMDLNEFIWKNDIFDLKNFSYKGVYSSKE